MIASYAVQEWVTFSFSQMVFFWQSCHWHCQCCNKFKQSIKSNYGDEILHFSPWLCISDPRGSSEAWNRDNAMWLISLIQQKKKSQLLSLTLKKKVSKNHFLQLIYDIFRVWWYRGSPLWTLIGQDQLQDNMCGFNQIWLQFIHMFQYFLHWDFCVLHSSWRTHL